MTACAPWEMPSSTCSAPSKPPKSNTTRFRAYPARPRAAGVRPAPLRSVRFPVFKVGERYYDAVVVPPLWRISRRTPSCCSNGSCKSAARSTARGKPTRLDGIPSARVTALAKANIGKPLTASNWSPRYSPRKPPLGLSIKPKANDRARLFHHRRQLEDGQLLFLVNSSLDSNCQARSALASSPSSNGI